MLQNLYTLVPILTFLAIIHRTQPRELIIYHVVFDGDDVSKIPNGSGSKTIHVKFVLQKECLFGEQFLLVGDDPIFGVWDPANGIPLDWSEEHFWTAEMDLPIGKSVKFKFIHQTSSPSAFHWQPGPDRVLEIWETTNTIVVTEDWENAEEQKLTEEQLSDVVVSEKMVDGNSSPPPQSIEEVISSSAIDQQSIAALLNVGSMSMDGNDLVVVPPLASNEGDVVLVSGPTPLLPVVVSWSDEAAAAAESGEMVDALLAPADEFNSLQLSEEQAGEPMISSENLLVKETIALSSSSKSIEGGGSQETVTGVVLSKDQRGRKAFQQLLSNLGSIWKRI